MNNHQGRGGLPLPPTNQDPRASRAPGQAPGKQGLYDPANEHDACGVGFVADIKGRKSHQILAQAIQVLRNLDHRGACGCEVNTGDGAGVWEGANGVPQDRPEFKAETRRLLEKQARKRKAEAMV